MASFLMDCLQSYTMESKQWKGAGGNLDGMYILQWLLLIEHLICNIL